MITNFLTNGLIGIMFAFDWPLPQVNWSFGCKECLTVAAWTKTTVQRLIEYINARVSQVIDPYGRDDH